VLAGLAGPGAAVAQGRKTVSIGVLSPFERDEGPAPSFAVFRDRLRELGLAEGVAFEYRWAEGRMERLRELADELVRSRVDVLLSAWGTPAALAAKGATTTVPVVFVAAGDAVGVGLVASLGRPGGNVTGSTFLTEEAAGKQLQLLREVAPKVARVATLFNPANPVYNPVLRSLESIGRGMGVQVVRLEIEGPETVNAAFEKARRERIGGLVVLRDSRIITHRDRIVGMAARLRVPAMYGMREFVEAGGLMSFEPSLADLYRRAAELVAKIVRGGRPAELPVERSTQFDLSVNLRTARALGLTIAPPVLARASHVIE
jgi:putative tryptophan/tyrosine transport system substrate-binding protein